MLKTLLAVGLLVLAPTFFSTTAQGSEPAAEYFVMAQPSVDRVVVRQRVVARQRRTPILNLLGAVRDRVALARQNLAVQRSKQVVRQNVVVRKNVVQQQQHVFVPQAFVAVEPVQYLLQTPQLIVVEPQVQHVQKVVQQVCVPQQVQQKVIVRQRQAVIGGCH